MIIYNIDTVNPILNDDKIDLEMDSLIKLGPKENINKHVIKIENVINIGCATLAYYILSFLFSTI